MFDTVLIANRGEIACRIIRTVRAMGLRAVAVYSDADAGAPHVKAADRAVRIGPGPAGESYLDGARIVQAAKDSGAGAIHPGYGFLSENAAFARAVEAAGLVFVGPPAGAIEAMGDKAAAKRLMEAAGVPCVPGYHGEDQSDARLISEAAGIGFPLMVKAAAGGGGKGMRLVTVPDDLAEALERGRSEALAAFGSDVLILERAVLRPRHVEIQVFADSHGACIHLGERDCSVQRRHQKVIEEAPAPGMQAALRAEMGAAAVQAAQAVGYRGAGTVEFLLGEDGYFFLEMNTRLQVEHPVTEMVTGLDLVAMQIAVAQGAPLLIAQEDVTLDGHAIEARLYAEDAGNGFLPVTGRVAHWQVAEGDGIRVDAGVAGGVDVSPYYDPMLAKLVAWGPDRETARRRLIGALEQNPCLGVTTNVGFLADILAAPGFAAGEVTTGFLEEAFPGGYAAPAPEADDLAIAAALILREETAAAQAAALMADAQLLGFASDGGRAVPLDISILGQSFALHGWVRDGLRWEVEGEGWRQDIVLEDTLGAKVWLRLDGARVEIWYVPDGAGGLYLQRGARAFHVERMKPGVTGGEAARDGAVCAPMPGQVIALDVAEGDRVAAGQRLAVLEAMKMQHQLVAETAGVVETLAVAEGAQVSSGQVIAVIGKEKA